MAKYPYEKEIERAAEEHGLTSAHVAAHVCIESDFCAEALRHEPKFQARYIDNNPLYQNETPSNRTLLATSMGLLQIMGVRAVELGMKARDLHQLLDPEVGLFYGCKQLACLYAKYRTLEDIIAAYNAGTARKLPNGTYGNNAYVKKVLRKYYEYFCH